MSYASQTKVIRAQDARRGDTVYLTACDAWSPDIAIAEVLQQDDFDWRLAFARRLREVVNADLIDAVEDPQGFAVAAAA